MLTALWLFLAAVPGAPECDVWLFIASAALSDEAAALSVAAATALVRGIVIATSSSNTPKASAVKLIELVYCRCGRSRPLCSFSDQAQRLCAISPISPSFVKPGRRAPPTELNSRIRTLTRPDDHIDPSTGKACRLPAIPMLTICLIALPGQVKINR